MTEPNQYSLRFLISSRHYLALKEEAGYQDRSMVDMLREWIESFPAWEFYKDCDKIVIANRYRKLPVKV